MTPTHPYLTPSTTPPAPAWARVQLSDPSGEVEAKTQIGDGWVHLTMNMRTGGTETRSVPLPRIVSIEWLPTCSCCGDVVEQAA